VFGVEHAGECLEFEAAECTEELCKVSAFGQSANERVEHSALVGAGPRFVRARGPWEAEEEYKDLRQFFVRKPIGGDSVEAEQRIQFNRNFVCCRAVEVVDGRKKASSIADNANGHRFRHEEAVGVDSQPQTDRGHGRFGDRTSGRAAFRFRRKTPGHFWSIVVECLTSALATGPTGPTGPMAVLVAALVAAAAMA